jgi:hypothetical protein
MLLSIYYILEYLDIFYVSNYIWFCFRFRLASVVEGGANCDL